MPSATWKAECEDYLRAAGSYANRSMRYQAVWEWLFAFGFEPGDLIVDIGAGMCDFARWGYSHDYAFRYLAIDGSIDGTDIENDEEFYPPVAEWYVCIETIEHLARPIEFLIENRNRPTKGMVLTTPNPDVTDVLALDPDHKTPVPREWFMQCGFGVRNLDIHYEGDTILATRCNK